MSTAAWTSDQVCEMAGITYRQLDYWARTRLVTPSLNHGSGSGGLGRRWSDDDLRRVQIVAALMCWAPGTRTRNTTRSAIHRVLQELPNMDTDAGYLVVGDEGVSWAADAAQLVEALAANTPSAWVLDLRAMWAAIPARRAS